jgi:hypothetical protein
MQELSLSWADRNVGEAFFVTTLDGSIKNRIVWQQERVKVTIASRPVLERGFLKDLRLIETWIRHSEKMCDVRR